jgi:hypothetical protein
MPKFTVRFEATAAVGVEIEIEADSADEAETKGFEWLDENSSVLEEAAGILDAPEETVRGYAETVKQPITRVNLELDEAGFELTEAF